MTSQAEPRLLSRADSGAVRHSLHLGGQGGEREDTERSLRREGWQEGVEDATARGGNQSQDKTTTAEFTIRIWWDNRRRLGGGGVINDNQDKRGQEGNRKGNPPLEELKEERSIYFRSHIKRA